jgi:outer membrane protein OmpA-like peptidoglycan-associated protein
MQITFPQGAAVLTTDSHAALEAYLASLPSADLDSIALLIDGRAHTDEGGDKEALRVLAEARGAAVAAICVAWGLPADNIATFVSWGEETAPEVLGAYLHFYHRGEK